MNINIQSVSDLTLEQADTPEFTLAFKRSTAAALKISEDNVSKVSYRNSERRRQLLAGE
jgi:hypothetical protein